MKRILLISVVTIFIVLLVGIEKDQLRILWLDRSEQNLPVGGVILPLADHINLETNHIPILLPHEHQPFGDSAEKHGVILLSDTLVVPEDLWVTGFSTKVNNAPFSTLHHALLARMDRQNPFCKDKAGYIYGAGSDTSSRPIIFPEPYGVFLSKGTPLKFYTMLHNPLPPEGEGGTYRDVSVTVKLIIDPASHTTRSRQLDYYRLLLYDVVSCEGNWVFTVPPRTLHFLKSADTANFAEPSHVTLNRSGTLVEMGGHYHAWQGGESVVALLNGKPMVTFISEMIGSDSWSWITRRIWPMQHLNAGDKISLSSTYSNPTDNPIVSAMGIVVFYFAPD